MAPKTAKQKFLVLASAVMFFGSTAAAAVHFIATATTSPTAPVADTQATIEQTAQGYEIILQREPNNQAALEGLMRSRMALGDPKATEPLAQLIKLNPQRQDYADLMQRLQSQQKGNYSSTNNPFSGSATVDR